MAQLYIPDSMPEESQGESSQRYNDYALEATQLSQPQFSQTQNTQNNGVLNSQLEPRHKYWATFIPTNAEHSILKIPWTKSSLQIGRGPQALAQNDVVLGEKRISNRHCRITLGINGNGTSVLSRQKVQAWKDGEVEPEVWIEDMNSSNGTFVNGQRIKTRLLIQHGDEISLGHAATHENHDVRYIFRSVGSNNARLNRSASKSGIGLAGAVYERYQLLDTLGTGTFAEVRKAVDVETGDLRAVKQIIKHRFANNPATLALFQREILICKALQHENICRLMECFEDPQHICLVLEYVDGGDLLDYIMQWPSEFGGLPESHVAELSLQICRAMAYTHGMNVTHRDLKPENILLTKSNTQNAVPVVKIADFGLAKMVHAETMLTSMVGTPQYLAPEVVMQTKLNPGYENVVDCWSVGIVIYSMLTKALPFEEDAEMPVNKRIEARYEQEPDSTLLLELGVSACGINFISRLLAKEPADRMTMDQALEHEWLAGPSSQQTESQQRGLGGDSVWEIQSFDGDEDEEYVTDDVENDMPWTRPGTVSGTNMESGIHSDESFSQPMGNLRLTTTGVFHANSTMSTDSRPAKSSLGMEGSPPSPPLTDEPMVTISPKNEESSKPPLLTPGPSEVGVATSLKRKQVENRADAFSSGSLSPLPDEPPVRAELRQADTSPTSRKHVQVAQNGTPTKAKPSSQDTPVPIEGVRQSPRRSARPRKSMRIA